MKLKTVSRWFFLMVVMALLANFVFLMLIRQAYLSAEQAVQRRTDTMKLVSGLQHETALLRRLVSAYTATADPRYLLYYYDVLAIREGSKPPPTLDNNGLYWEDVIAGRRPHKLPTGQKGVPLIQRMQALDISEDELQGLRRVLDASERLKKTEQIAFAATQGLYDRVHQTYVSDGEPDLKFAGELVHSPNYEAQSADLARAVANLSLATDARTAAARVQAATQLERYIIMTLGVDLALLPALLLGLYAMQSRLLQPITRLDQVAHQLARGNYDARAGGRQKWAEELDTLATTLNTMAHAVQDDISQRARVQAQLREARDQAEAATRAKSMFLANMSHEIRTPMNAILGMSHLALQTSLDEQQRDYLNKVQSASTILLGVINDILDFSKIEAGKLELESAPFCIEDVVGNAMSLLRQRAQEKDVELLCAFEDPSLLADAGTVYGDALRLGQVLTNLISNAVKFTHFGHVKLTVGLISRVGERLMLRFEVRDTGIGMSESQVDRLFLEFTQADGSTTRKYGGTGLGLSISKRLARLMGGDIVVASKLGGGSCFTFTVPLRVAEASGLQTLPRNVDGMRVLVVDDQSETCQTLSGLLGAMGVGQSDGGLISAVSTGDDAVRAVQQAVNASQPYDLVLLDWVMPGLSGADTLARLREIQPDGMVVVTSAYGSDNLRAEAMKGGAHTFLTKPILPEALRTLLHRLKGSGAAVPAQVNTSEDVVQLDGLRLLLVEDNLLNQQLATELLCRRGARVDVATNGMEALERLRQGGGGAYDVVLMDLQMPVMDGYETTREIRNDPSLSHLPVIAMTAHAMAEERERCLALGMVNHIAKPLDPAALYAALAPFCGLAAKVVADPHQYAATRTRRPAQTVPDIEGIDVAAALAHFEGDLPLFKLTLNAFVAHARHILDWLPQALAQSDWPALLREAHTLKGLGGTIGSAPLRGYALALELAAREEDAAAVQQAAETLVQALAPLVKTLQNYLTEIEVTSSEQAAAQAASERDLGLAQRLKQLAGECDSEALALWQQHRNAFAAWLPAVTTARLNAALARCDFDSAFGLLDELDLEAKPQ
ncbi:MAG: response regulator [Aquabacterium sp.]|uniref:hybrid sensor histidine kinase/response regulator n=1 Tax=Aquabacterium sp. TaxID=1872578 RepID=UPI0025C2C897|nr:hybrid sensor histidine kinase/response regulator [Aquabacterium sp.]MBI3380459.1 response regulator [Aquabacterium sp.]